MQRTIIENLTREHMNRQRMFWCLDLTKQNDRSELIADIGSKIVEFLWEK